MLGRKKEKAIIRVTKVTKGRKREYFREITLNMKPLDAWKAVCHGLSATQDIDVAELRAERKRKGGKR